MKIGDILKSALPVVVGIVLFAVGVKFAADNDIPWVKDLRDAFDS